MSPPIVSAQRRFEVGQRSGVRATVFGLDVRAESPLSFLRAVPAAPTGRTLDIAIASECSTAPDWPGSGELVCDQRERDGTVSFRIEAHPDAGYLISGPAYGSHLVSADGRRALCAPAGCATGAWQRLLIAQVLPFAALLNGLEVLHASAVVMERGAVAFVGPSRAGKTSVALELCRRGVAGFLADDVLALERSGERLLGHPGTAIAALDHGEAHRLARIGRAQEGETVAINDRERLVRMRGAAKAVPLVALFFIDRRREALGEPRFEPVADPRLLLGGTFNSVLTTPSRLLGLLEVCALAARRRVERVVLGPHVGPPRLCDAIERRLGGAS